MADLYPVKADFSAKARIDKNTYETLYRESIEHPDAFWGKAAQRLQWFKQPTTIKNVSYNLDDFRIKWFEDGELNASVNCLDRQLEQRGDKVALLFEPDSPTHRRRASPTASCTSACAGWAMRCATWACRRATGSPSTCR